MSKPFKFGAAEKKGKPMHKFVTVSQNYRDNCLKRGQTYTQERREEGVGKKEKVVVFCVGKEERETQTRGPKEGDHHELDLLL